MRNTKPDRRRRNGLAAFRAIEAEVRAALLAGFTLIAIWEEKRLRLGMSYAQFARYAGPLRAGPKGQRTTARGASQRPDATTPPPRAELGQPREGREPLRGRPELAMPSVNVDTFAADALNKQNLI
jgi:Family of unknown function (DUF5338)